MGDNSASQFEYYFSSPETPENPAPRGGSPNFGGPAEMTVSAESDLLSTTATAAAEAVLCKTNPGDPRLCFCLSLIAPEMLQIIFPPPVQSY